MPLHRTIWKYQVSAAEPRTCPRPRLVGLARFQHMPSTRGEKSPYIAKSKPQAATPRILANLELTTNAASPPSTISKIRGTTRHFTLVGSTSGAPTGARRGPSDHQRRGGLTPLAMRAGRRPSIVLYKPRFPVTVPTEPEIIAN